MKNTLEGIKSRLDEAEEWISELENKVEKYSQTEQQNKKKKAQKNKEGLREQQDNKTCTSIRIIRIPKREEEEQGIGNLF